MRVLVACEFTGTVRDAFIRRGHDAWSCDLRPAEGGGPHIRWDVRRVLEEGWDLMIAHPPCTHLCVSGAQWFPKKHKRQQRALDFVLELLNAPIHSICIENPIGILSTVLRPPHQIVQPWWFGDSYQKSTCLWLKNLPRLRKTKVVDRGEFMELKGGKRQPTWYALAPKEDRSAHRSRTFPGMAEAMAAQWGCRKHTTGFGVYPKFSMRKPDAC